MEIRQASIENREKQAKGSAHYQREFRRRMREQGLVKKELWVRSENVSMLAGIEGRLRQQHIEKEQGLRDDPIEGMQHAPWAVQSLHSALLAHALSKQGVVDIELLSDEPVMVIRMKQFSNLPLFLSVTGDQIIVEAVLWATEQVKDPVSFNELILRTHKYLPLSTVGVERIGDQDYYCLFGSLSARSILESVVFEIETLAENVVDALDTYGDMLRD